MALSLPKPNPGAVRLGRVTLSANGQVTPTLVIGPGWQQLFVYHLINGYTGSQIARLLFGNGTTVDTGATYSSLIGHMTAGSSTLGSPTARVSQNGMQVANDATANGRRGLHDIWNPKTDPKMVDTRTITFNTQNPNSASATQSTISEGAGNWWNTTDQIQCLAMDSGAAGTNLLSGSFIDVVGIPGI